MSKINKRINILHLVEHLAVGGMENGLVNLANQFSHDRFGFFISCFTEKGALADRITADAARVFELNYGPGFHLDAVWPIARLLKKHDIHILHTHGWGTRSLVGLMGGLLARTPVCVNGEHGQLHIEKKIQLWAQRMITPLFKDTLSVSSGLKAKLEQQLKIRPHKITVIPNGVDLKKFHGRYPVEPVYQEFGLCPQDFKIAVIGSLKHQKNQGVVIKALALLKKSGANAKLLLIGDGPDRDELEKLTNRLSVRDDVLFIGNRNDIENLLAISDVVVSSSILDFEGMSNVMLEAMASGVPVVASESVGSRELIDNDRTGLFFDAHCSEDLKAKLMALYKHDRARMNIAENALADIRRNFSLERMVRRYEDYYQMLYDKYIERKR